MSERDTLEAVVDTALRGILIDQGIRPFSGALAGCLADRLVAAGVRVAPSPTWEQMYADHVRLREAVHPDACACGASPVHGHHDDYDKPLEVRWLCRLCHEDVHRQMRKEAVRG